MAFNSLIGLIAVIVNASPVVYSVTFFIYCLEAANNRHIWTMIINSSFRPIGLMGLIGGGRWLWHERSWLRSDVIVLFTWILLWFPWIQHLMWVFVGINNWRSFGVELQSGNPSAVGIAFGSRSIDIDKLNVYVQTKTWFWFHNHHTHVWLHVIGIFFTVEIGVHNLKKVSIKSRLPKMN